MNQITRILVALALLVAVLPLSVYAAAPVATAFNTTVPVNATSVIQLQGADADGTPLTFATTSSPSHGALSQFNPATGVVLYKPATGFTGTDTFNFTVASGGDTSTAAAVTITVTNAKTRIIDHLENPDGSPRTGKITFILTEQSSSPAGIVPAKASVSAVLDSGGAFDVSLYPSRAYSPQQYYQVDTVDNSGAQQLLGIYDIPAATTIQTLAPYRVTDTNLAARYTFPNAAAIAALTGVTNQHIGVGSDLPAANTVLAGTSPGTSAWGPVPNGALPSNPTFGGTVTAGAVNASGTVAAGAFAGDGSQLTNLPIDLNGALLDAGALKYSASTVTDMSVFLDALPMLANDGASISTWTDLTGNGRDATATDPTKPFTYHWADAEDGQPYLQGAEDRSLTVPIPATSTKTLYLVLNHSTNFPNYTPLYFSNSAKIYGNYVTQHYGGFQTNLGGGSADGGYAGQWAVLCWRQSGTAVTIFYNGVPSVSFTLSASSTTSTLQLGPGNTKYRQLAFVPAAESDAAVLRRSNQLLKSDALNYEIDLLNNLAAPALVMYKRGVPGKRPLVLLQHAAGEGEGMWRELAAFRPLTQALVNAGYVVVASRQHGDNWGNQSAIDDLSEAYTYVAANYPVDSGKVALVGDSMGGISTMLAFPLASSSLRAALKGAALYYPVEDVAYQRTYNPSMGTSIDAAYGGSFPANGTGHNPVSRSASDWSGKRFIWFASTLDTVVPYTQNTAAMRTLVNGVATENTFVELNAGHNGSAETTVAALLDFMKRCFN